MSLGLASMAMPLIDRFPRQKFMAFGIAWCMTCLTVEAAIIANFGATLTNTAALRGGVAMFFVYQLGYCIFLDGKASIGPRTSVVYPYDKGLTKWQESYSRTSARYSQITSEPRAPV